MKIKAIQDCTYNINGAPHGRRTLKAGEVDDLPARFAVPFVNAGKAKELGYNTKVMKPKEQSVKNVIFKKAHGWIQQYENGVKVDSMREDEFNERFPNQEIQ
jgi:hypothetical protein